ncbi:MAG: hypothetical protein PHD63_04330 [Candidatus Marinimicrobia bacterium]|jgi:hypothetical protein|nr:hypothetical protein [Candidatus Neomarinimicrobiota bacterium]
MNAGIGICAGFNCSVYCPPTIPLSFNDQLLLRFGLVGFILYWIALCLALIVILNVGARTIEKVSGVDIIDAIVQERKRIK